MNHKLFSRAFIALTFFLLLFFVFNLGIDAAKSDGKEAVVDGVQALFWLFAFVLFSKMNRETDKIDRELEESHRKLDDAMEGLMKTLKEGEAHNSRVHHAMHLALESIGEDRPPKPSEFKKVQDVFHKESNGLYLKLTAVKGDKRPKAEVSDKPFVQPAPKKAPVKKPVVATKKTVTAKKGK